MNRLKIIAPLSDTIQAVPSQLHLHECGRRAGVDQPVRGYPRSLRYPHAGTLVIVSPPEEG